MTEHFVAFDEIKRISPGGGRGAADWLMFGFPQIHSKKRREDREALTLCQAFLNPEQLVRALQEWADARPAINDQQVINRLAATA